MGAAVWEFMWLLDKVTRVDANGEGWVLGGKPIKLAEVANDLEVNEVTVSETLKEIEKEGYIRKITAPYGLSIRVIKTKKRFSKNLKPPSEKAKPPSENLKPNKTVSVDITVDSMQPTAAPPVFDYQEYLKKMQEDKRRHVRIIAFMLVRKKMKFTAQKQVEAAIAMYSKDAVQVATFETPKIKQAILKIEQEVKEKNYDWGMRTILKKLTNKL